MESVRFHLLDRAFLVIMAPYSWLNRPRTGASYRSSSQFYTNLCQNVHMEAMQVLTLNPLAVLLSLPRKLCFHLCLSICLSVMLTGLLQKMFMKLRGIVGHNPGTYRLDFD